MTPEADRPPDDLDALREAFHAAVERSAGEVRPPGCVDEDRIWAAAAGDLDAASVRQIVDHLAGCPRCAESWRLAVSMSESVRSARAPIVRRPAVAIWVSFAIAATLVAAVSYVLLPRGTDNEATTFRSATATTIESLVTDTTLPRDGFVLRWTPGPAGTTYSVAVSDEQGRALHEARDLQQPEVTVPAAALAGLTAASRIVWRVDAVLPDGRKVTSRSFDVILR